MQSDKFKLGLFILLSFIVICLLFIVFGVFDYGTVKAPVMTLFEESVQGLETGSQVKLRGVPIGSVKDITISMEGKLIRVDMEIDLGKVRTQPLGGNTVSRISEEEFQKFMVTEIQAGLRARLEMNGIAGGKYVEFDYVQPEDMRIRSIFTIPGNEGESGTFYIPAEPSMLAGLRTSLAELIAKIASIDYKGISDKLEKVLDRTEVVVGDPSIPRTLKNLEEISVKLSATLQAADTAFQTVNSALTPEKVRQITDNTDQLILQLKESTRNLEAIVKDAKIPESTAAFRDAAGTIASNRQNIKETMARINDSLAALEELLRTIENNPSVLIRGKKK